MNAYINVKVDPDRLNFPLRPAHVGKLSSAEFAVSGVPPSLTNLRIIFTTPDGSTYTVVGSNATGEWRVYASPFTFPAAAVNLKYDVIADDAFGNPRWLGRGILEVHDCPADGSGDVPPVIPRDTYIRNPVTGLYHLLTAIVDDDGNITLDLSKEGIQK